LEKREQHKTPQTQRVWFGLVWFNGVDRYFQQYLNYIMAVSLLVEETGGPGENHRPITSH
jgi:hypothetical protein